MPFIGIVTNLKNEQYMKKMLSMDFPIENIIFITNKNIENIKNIRFETVVIDSKIEDLKNLKLIVSNAKYIILNADLNIDLKLLEDLNLVIITYGFNNKATFSVSSVSEINIIICLQRIINNIFEEKYEPQEFEINVDQNIDIHAILCTKIILIIYKKMNTLST